MQLAERLRSRVLIFIAVLAIFCVFSSAVSWSQATQQFTGHVLDSSGAVLPSAEVVVHNQSTGVDFKTITTSDGVYTIPYLNPGTYDITVTKEGFKTEKKTNIQLNIAQTSTIDFELGVGTASEVITVNSSATQIELSKSDRGEVIESARVTEMPLDGRNPFNLVTLSPGAHDFSSSQYPRPFDNVTGNQYVNGSPQVSQTNIDGVGNDAADLGRTAYTPSVDVIQEFKVVLNAYDASYGHSGGSSIDVSLKSGGDQFHGDVFEYARRSWMDAYDWQSKYNNPSHPVKVTHKRDQFGFEADGPIVIPHLYSGKHKLFFLTSYEEMKDILPNPSYNVYSLPNSEWLTGDFSTAKYWNTTTNSLQSLTIYDPLTPLQTVVDPIDGKTKQSRSAFAGNKIPSSRIDPVAAKILSYYSYLKPNVDPGAGYAPGANNYENLQVENDLWRNAVIKIDYNPTDADKLSFRWAGQGRWITSNWNTGAPAADPANSNGRGAQPKTHTGSVQWTHIFGPDLLFNLGVSLMTYYNTALEGSKQQQNMLSELGFASEYYSQVQNIHYFPNINMSGLPNSADYAFFGPNWLGYSGDRHALNFLPTLTYIRGAHTIRTGVNLNFSQWLNPEGGNADSFNFSTNFTNQYYNASDAPGYSSGLSIASLLLGYPNSGTVNWNVHQFWSQHYIAPWVQDDWKVTKKLTLNLGLRWDFLTPQVERHNKMIGAFNATVLNPVSASIPSGTTALGASPNLQGGVTFAGVNGQRRGAYAMNMLNVQPRVGFAYAITDRMSIRGGIGETYMSDTSTNDASGFSSSTSYTNSIDNGVTPYTASTGLGLRNPLSTVLQPTGSSLGYLQNLGSSFSYYNPRFHIPAIWSYSLTYEIGLSKYDVVSLAYVGNRVPNNPVSDDINHIAPQWNAQCDVERGGNRHLCDDTATGQIANPFLGVSAFAGTSYYSSNTISKSNFTRPFPAFTTVTENGATNDGKSWYNSFQATASHQFANNLSLHATYTHAKAMTSGGWVDTVNRVWARQLSTTNDVNHSITFSGVAYLPFGRNRLFFSKVNRWVDGAINGWQLSPLYTWYSGFAWRPTENYAWDISKSAGQWEMASTGGTISSPMGVSHTILNPDSSHKDHRIRGVTPCVGYKDTDTGNIIASPAATAAGCSSIQFVKAPNAYAVGRANVDFGVRQPGAYRFDLAASKNFKIPEASRFYLSEGTNLQLRVDLLNAFNHPAWDEGFNNDPTSVDFGTIRKGPSGPTNTPRYLQVSAKLSW